MSKRVQMIVIYFQLTIKKSIFIPEQRINRLNQPPFKNNERFSAQGKNLWSNFLH